MRKYCVLISLFCALILTGCSKKDISTNQETTQVFSSTIKSADKNIASIRNYENTILRLYFEHSVPILEQSFMGVEPESYEGDDYVPEKLDMEGKYSGTSNFSIYSKTEADNYFSINVPSSNELEGYSEKEISRYNEMSKALVRINVNYGVNMEENYITQNFTIEDVKGEKYFILLKWRGDECVEISYKDFTYLW